MREQLLNNFETVKADMKKYADRRRRTVDDLLKPGAKAYVYMPAKQLKQHGLRPSKKLGNKCFGPFEIERQVSANSFKLNLGLTLCHPE